MAEMDVIEIDCGNALGISDVAGLYTKLINSIAEGHQIKLNISKLERIDASAIQMLYALKKELSEHGLDVVWTAPSDAFKTALGLLGLADKMNIDENNIS